jgi:hypothetical protein
MINITSFKQIFNSSSDFSFNFYHTKGQQGETKRISGFVAKA